MIIKIMPVLFFLLVYIVTVPHPPTPVVLFCDNLHLRDEKSNAQRHLAPGPGSHS